MQSPLSAVLLIVLLSLKSGLAHAYLDPGSISLVLQAIIAAIAGGLMTVKYWYWRVLRFFGRNKEGKKTKDHIPPSSDNE